MRSNSTTPLALIEFTALTMIRWGMVAELISEKIEITDTLLDALKAEQGRTGKGVQAILRGTRNSRPQGISVGMVVSWLNGTTNTAEIEHVEYMKQLWASYPNKEAAWVVLTDNNRKFLQRKIKETGLSAYKLFSKRGDLPKNFNPNHVHNYFTLNRSKIEKTYFDYILKVARANKGKGYIPVSEEFLWKLNLEIQRTGMPSTTLINRLKKKGYDVKVHAYTVTAWLSGKTKLANRTDMNWIMQQYAALSDKQMRKPLAKPISKFDAVAHIATTDLKKMQQYREVLGILPSKIFEGVKDTPEDLNTHRVSSWLNGNTKTANPAHIEWVLKRCRELLESAVKIDPH